MNYKSIHRAKRRGHVGVVQSPYFSFLTRRVKSNKKGATYMSSLSGLSNNSRWFKGNASANPDYSLAPLFTSGKFTRL